MDSTCRKKNDKDEPDIVVVVRGASENHGAEARSCFIVADAALKGRSSTAASAHGSFPSCKNAGRMGHSIVVVVRGEFTLRNGLFKLGAYVATGNFSRRICVGCGDSGGGAWDPRRWVRGGACLST